MNKYTNFFGVDVAKDEFVAAVYGQKGVSSYTNDHAGIGQFVAAHGELLKSALVVLENTGGYEFNLLKELITQGIDVHRTDNRKVKHFIQSIRAYGKTDALDAAALAAYAHERHAGLPVFRLSGEAQCNLQVLVRARADLVVMRVQLSNQSQAPMGHVAASEFGHVSGSIDEAIGKIEQKIHELVANDPMYQQKKEILMSLPGVGETTAHALLALMPELGSMTRRGVAHLAGLAPHPRDSGTLNGYRSVRGGRPEIKRLLFMAAMAASRSKSRLGDFYRALVARGKKKMVALTALMRKIIVILNAKVRDMMKSEQMINNTAWEVNMACLAS